MAKTLTLGEAAAFVHKQYLEHLEDERRRFEEEAAEIRREEDESAWWVVDRWLQTQEGIDKLTKMIADAQTALNSKR